MHYNKDPDFWREVATVLVDNKHNSETSRNGYPIRIFQGELSHKPFFITIDNRGQVIIGPMYMVGELEVLV